MNKQRKAYEKKLETQLKERNDQIDLLKVKTEDVGADAKAEYPHSIKTSEGKLNTAKTKLHKMKATGDEAWEAVKTGAEKTWVEAKTAVQDAVSKFK